MFVRDDDSKKFYEGVVVSRSEDGAAVTVQDEKHDKPRSAIVCMCGDLGVWVWVWAWVHVSVRA